jgi:hypothetical protein
VNEALANTYWKLISGGKTIRPPANEVKCCAEQ